MIYLYLVITLTVVVVVVVVCCCYGGEPHSLAVMYKNWRWGPQPASPRPLAYHASCIGIRHPRLEPDINVGTYLLTYLNILQVPAQLQYGWEVPIPLSY
ncbi:hypothetical protein F4809DRAFT_76919 [Biscogniauxia mediterranea]|nr:hypothetical protein F4809DRAFT_76919 [Biscogniauxia mediterranea]